MSEELFLTPDELRARWKDRMAVATLGHWRRLGKGPRFTKVGGSVLYPISAIEEFEKAQEYSIAGDFTWVKK